MIKEIIGKFYKPTPKKWRKIGDMMLVICLFATPFEIVRDSHTLGIVFLFIGVIGKFLTNCFTDESKS